jgi:predicted DNA-binding protein with PD1-like motif
MRRYPTRAATTKRRLRITGASFTAIGACPEATLGFFDLAAKDYLEIPIDEQVEVLALTGNVGVHHGETKVHAHVVPGAREGDARGGHLLERP